MRILCFIDSLGSGGAQRQLVNLSIGFKEMGHDVSFLVYHDRNFYKELLIKANIPVELIKEPNYLKRLFKIRKYLRKGKYDSVLSFLEAPNLICEITGLPFKKWKLVVGERSANPNISKSLKLKVFRWFHLFADHIVANSHENIRIVRKVNPFLCSKKCHVIYNMIDSEKWNPVQAYSSNIKGKFLLVVAASHNSYKNLNGLIEALNLLSKKELDSLIIHWYGDSITEPYVDTSYKEGIKKIKEYQLESTIKFLPATKEIKEVIHNADGVGLFSFFEGFPNVICEGMACAKAVISSKVSDIPEILYYDSHILFNPNDIDSIKNSLSYLLSLSTEKLKELGSLNLKIAEEKFNKETIIDQYLDLLQK